MYGFHSDCSNHCFNHRCILRENRIAKTNCSIETLDIKPNQWRQLCREEAGGRKKGRNEWQTREEWRVKLRREEQYRFSGGWEGVWEEGLEGGWEEDSRSRSRSSSSSIKRCVSMDIKLLDSFNLKESFASF